MQLPPHHSTGSHPQSRLHDYFYIVLGIIESLVFLLATSGFLSPTWRHGDYGNRHIVDVGLVMRCHTDTVSLYHMCAPFSLGAQEGRPVTYL